ncbi:hypothetical protein ACSMX9_12415 [Streptomyces sp. LE64]|uniref:hypothetical protein n=1 Tax=unclassified Streptomyces TaxID=2593676 RepID=UPI003318B272
MTDAQDGPDRRPDLPGRRSGGDRRNGDGERRGPGHWRRQGLIPVSRRAPDTGPGRPRTGRTGPERSPGGPEPEYARLARLWRHAGRTVPGRPDPEWESLVRRNIWPP